MTRRPKITHYSVLKDRREMIDALRDVLGDYADRHIGPKNLGRVQLIPIGELVLMQSETYEEDVNEYAASMASGAMFPPIVITDEGKVLDGHHRIAASVVNGYSHVPAHVIPRQVKTTKGYEEPRMSANRCEVCNKTVRVNTGSERYDEDRQANHYMCKDCTKVFAAAVKAASKNPVSYPLPQERLLVSMNPAKEGFADAFGIPYEAHLVPAYPRKRRAVGPTITGPQTVADYLKNLQDSPVERFLVVLLNAKNQIIGVVIASQGTLNESAVHPREVFAAAIASRAAAIILAHNHPSGETTPSQADEDVSTKLVDVGKIIGIHVLDHVIIGGYGRFTSLKAIGMI